MGKTALEIGADTFAFFTRNPRGGKAKDIDFEDSAISQRERLDHINTVLDSANLNIYRRHIAPKV